MRTLTPRDAILVLVGAGCMHLAYIFGPLAERSQIVVNTHVTSPDYHPDEFYDNFHKPVLEDPSAIIEFGSDRGDNSPVILPPPPPPPLQDVQPVSQFTTTNIEYEIPETVLVSHAPGWTVFRNLYMAEGTLYIVTSSPELFPDISLMTSTGLPAENTPESIEARMPTDKDMKLITPTEAATRWGADSSVARDKNRIFPVGGATALFNDPSQFLDHYYHFCAELLFGLQAIWTGAFNSQITLSSTNPSTVQSTAPPITRAIFAHTSHGQWRDKPGFNSYFFRAAFPSITVESQEDWEDRISSTIPVIGLDGLPSHKQRAWWFDNVVLTDRSAAFRGVECGSVSQRTAAEAIEAVKGMLDRHWWEPVRRAVLRFAGVPKEVLSISDVEEQRVEDGLKQDKVVVTYINRQGTRRHLIEEDHEGLVKAMEELCERRGWEWNNVQAEKLTKEQQLEVAAKTTFMLGVHGNGLTHLIMMPVTPISAVIEIFYPGGFAHDYEWTARARGMKHFAVWNDTSASYPDPRAKDPAYPEGFQGTSIPVYGPYVAQLLEDRYDGRV